MSKKSFDLGSVDTTSASNNPHDVVLRDPFTKKPVGVIWTIVGSESSAAKEYNEDKFNADQRKLAYAKKRGKDIDPPTLQELVEETCKWLTVCSIGWRTDDGDTKINFAGESLEFNVQNCMKVLMHEKSAWIRTQLSENILDLENFTPR